MLTGLPGGPWPWGIAVVVLLALVIVMQFRRTRPAFRKPYERYDVTEIPPETAGTREFIVRDDATGSRLQFVTVGAVGRVVVVVVPGKHLRSGVEAALFQAARPSAQEVTAWTWPPLNDDGYAMVRELARTMPGLEFFDANGVRVR